MSDFREVPNKPILDLEPGNEVAMEKAVSKQDKDWHKAMEDLPFEQPRDDE